MRHRKNLHANIIKLRNRKALEIDLDAACLRDSASLAVVTFSPLAFSYELVRASASALSFADAPPGIAFNVVLFGAALGATLLVGVLEVVAINLNLMYLYGRV